MAESFWRSYRAPLFSSLVLLCVYGVLLACVLCLNEGFFSYCLDDAYIHLAVAKTLGSFFHFGLGPYSIATPSSSPFYSLLLASLFWIVPAGFFVFVPFVVSILAQIGCFFVLSILIRRVFSCGDWVLAIFLIFLGGISFFPFLAFSGMEHSLQILFALLFFDAVLSYFEHKPLSLLRVTLWASFLVFTRYDSALLCLSFVVYLVLLRRWKAAFIFLLVILLGPLVFGGVSLFLGLPFLPMSIVGKSLHGFFSLKSPVFFGLSLVMGSVGMVLFFVKKQEQVNRCFLSFLFLSVALACLGQAFFGGVGNRYVSFLVVLTLLCLFLIGNYKGRVLSMGFFSLLFFLRVSSILHVPYAAHNIYEQQLQISRMISTYFPKDVVAVNDIGALGYSGVEIVDLCGLSDLAVLRQKLRVPILENDQIRPIFQARHVTLIAVYRDWFPRVNFEQLGYSRVVAWTLQDNIVCGGDTVTLYVRNDRLERYTPAIISYTRFSLPKSVKYSFFGRT